MLKIWRKRSLESEIAAIKASLAHVDLEDLRERYAGQFYAKYFDLDRWIEYNVRIVRELGLFAGAPVEALDIGCGGGLLLHCLNYYGHRAIGIDRESPLFTELAAKLGVDRRVSPVEPFRPLSVPGTFDLITVVSPGFDLRRLSDSAKQVWGAKEWGYFLEDVGQRLHRGGRLYVRLNHARSPEIHDALSSGLAPSSNHLENRREFIYDQAKLRLAINLLHRQEAT